MSSLRHFRQFLDTTLKKLTPEQAAECQKYLTEHKFAALRIPGKTGLNIADYEPGLDNRATTIDAVVRALMPLTLLNPVDELHDLVQFRYSTLVALEIAAAKGGSTGGDETRPKPKEDDGLETSVELDPKKGTLETQIQYTIGLRAKDESGKVQVLPDVELTLHVGADGKAGPVAEAQLNAIKVHIERNLKLVGKIEIEATVGLNEQVNLGPDILKSVQTSVKGELEIKLGRISLKGSLEVDPTKRKPVPEPGVAIVLWRW